MISFTKVRPALPSMALIVAIGMTCVLGSCKTRSKVTGEGMSSDPYARLEKKFASGFAYEKDEESGENIIVADPGKKTPFGKNAYNAGNGAKFGKDVRKKSYASTLFGGKKAAEHKTFSQSGKKSKTMASRDGSKRWTKIFSRDGKKSFNSKSLDKPGYGRANDRAKLRQSPEFERSMNNASPPPIVADPGSGFAPMTVNQVKQLLENSRPD